MREFVLAVVLLSAGLAGCIGNESRPASPQGDTSDQAAADGGPASLERTDCRQQRALFPLPSDQAPRTPEDFDPKPFPGDPTGQTIRAEVFTTACEAGTADGAEPVSEALVTLAVEPPERYRNGSAEAHYVVLVGFSTSGQAVDAYGEWGIANVQTGQASFELVAKASEAEAGQAAASGGDVELAVNTTVAGSTRTPGSTTARFFGVDEGNVTGAYERTLQGATVRGPGNALLETNIPIPPEGQGFHARDFQAHLKPVRGLNLSTPDETETLPPLNATDLGPIEQWDAYIQAVRNGTEVKPPRIEDPGHADEHVVVAVIDSGVNPFHDVFREPEVGKPGALPVQAVDQASGDPPLYVPIQPVDSMEKTDWLSQALESRTLYNFAGTNLMFYSVAEEVESPDPDGHGTGTAGTVAKAAPNATIVAVQETGNLTGAFSWAAKQPWIDIVTRSSNCARTLANQAIMNACPEAVVDHNRGDPSALAAASHTGWQAGKLWLNSAGNSPTPAITDDHDGPPWVISVGGADQYRRGETVVASKVPDVLSNFIVEELPQRDSTNETEWSAGTSYSTPLVAGTLGDAVLELREQAGYNGTIEDGQLVPPMDLTNTDVRSAMNRTAIYWGPQDYRPSAPGHPAPGVPDFAGTPIAPGAPWAQMGWGYVNASLSDEIADALASDELPSKPPGAVAYMDARQEARKGMWS